MSIRAVHRMAEAARPALVQRHAPMVSPRLPGRHRRPPRCPGRRPGHIPHPGSEGMLHPTRRGAGELALRHGPPRCRQGSTRLGPPSPPRAAIRRDERCVLSRMKPRMAEEVNGLGCTRSWSVRPGEDQVPRSRPVRTGGADTRAGRRVARMCLAYSSDPALPRA